MKTEIWGDHQKFDTIEQARAACNVPPDFEVYDEMWNGECYHDRDIHMDYWPVWVYEVDDDGEIIQGIELIGYIEKP